MNFGDLPQPPEKPKAAEVRTAKNNEAGEKPSFEVMTLLAQYPMSEFIKNQHKQSKSEVLNHGQIEKLKLPAGWSEKAESMDMGGIGVRSLREFHPADNTDANLSLFYRGLPISEAGGKALRQVLQSAPHKLSDDEIKSIGDALDAQGDPNVFALKSATTEDLNGKRVLKVEGEYKASNMAVKDYLVDAEGTGRVIQEICYQAPQKVFERYAKDADDAINSILWKSTKPQGK